MVKLILFDFGPSLATSLPCTSSFPNPELLSNSIPPSCRSSPCATKSLPPPPFLAPPYSFFLSLWHPTPPPPSCSSTNRLSFNNIIIIIISPPTCPRRWSSRRIRAPTTPPRPPPGRLRRRIRLTPIPGNAVTKLGIIVADVEKEYQNFSDGSQSKVPTKILSIYAPTILECNIKY